MKWHGAILVLLVCLGVADVLVAADTVKKKSKETIFGKIVSMDSRKVVLDDRSTKTKIPVGDIASISYDGEPEALARARANIAHGRNEEALRALGEIRTGRAMRKVITADIDFYKALAAAHLALRGKGEIRDAGGQMLGFVKRHGDNYHWFEANRLVGDLLIANGQYTSALDYYADLAKAPWLVGQLQAAVGRGRALLADQKTDEALASFQAAIDLKAANPLETGADVLRQERLAQIGKARCLAAQGKTDEAVVQLKEILDKIDAEDAALCAPAYNALGTALRASGKPHDALLAFLHVDVLYFVNPEEHAEALANLAALWQEVHKTDRAIRAQETLRGQYPNSRWASE